MRTFRKTMLSTLLTPVALLAMTPAGAQSAATPAAPREQDETVQQLDTIVVTGIRGSLEAARDIKRDSAQIVDAIVADDIGKLPDTNVAESLSRVSGVQIDRGIGEGSDISIRGLRENVVLYNGRQIVDSTGRGGNGLDQLGTSTYGLLSLVPSELISRLTVTKLAGAEQIAGALGGIVDIETRLPLSSDGLQVAASAAATYDELADEPGFESFGLISQTFADNRFGALLTASYSERSLAQQGLDTFSGYARFNDPTTTPPTPRFGHSDVRAQNIAEDRDKVGLSGVLQWRPADGVEIVADTFYSKLSSERDRHWLSFNPTAGLSNARYSDNDILLSGRATGPVLSNTEFADIESEVWSTALRGSFRVGERLGASAELSHGRSQSEYQQVYLRLQPLATITPTIDFDLTAGDFGSFAINGIDLTDPNQLRYTILFDNLYRSETETFAARSDWSLDFDSSWLRSLDFGARYSTLETVQNPLRADIRPAGGIPANQLGGFLTTYRNNDFLPGEFANLPRSYLAGLRDTLTGCAAFTAFPAVSQNSQCLDPANNTNALASTFDIDETFLEGHAKLNFDTDLGAMRLSGNVGVRFIDRDLESAGNLISGTGAATPAVFKRNDDEWLPSAVAKLEVTEDFVVRAGAARVLAFPNTEDLNNGLTLFNNAVFDGNGVQISPGTGNGGAPDLDPFRADQFDVSLEYYFGEQALVSAGLFHKDVSSFIVQRQSAETYGGVNYLINRKINGEGATVQGVELLAQVPFTFLPEPFDGFGMVATYSYIDSETPIRDISGRALSFPGLSKNNVNLIGYYERGPFSARLAYNWRDEYLVALSASATGIYNDTYKDLSATLRYDLTDTVSINFEGNNLLDSEQRTYDGSEEGLRTNAIFGRIYKATLSIRF
jgi:TonB-dependent receptor